jgi:hypothetical protein
MTGRNNSHFQAGGSVYICGKLMREIATCE